jgi:transcription antitermination factor NusG
MRSQTAGTRQRGTGRKQSIGPAPMGLRGSHSGTSAAASALEDATAIARHQRELLPGERWFAVHCQAHREHGAAMQLRGQGFEVFLPLRPKTWRHARRIETRYVPFFPGYLFVVLDLVRDRWRRINGTFGVQRLVMVGSEDRPIPLPRGMIEALRREADARGCLRPGGLLRVGQAVRILAGPFGDRMGELIELDEAGRIRVLIELLGGRIPVVLSPGEVMATR